jgi:hypothetical protein
MRDERWLHQLLDSTWDSYFPDIPQDNIVRIRFGRKAKTRLGSISIDRAEPDVSIITLNGLFKDRSIPEFVIQATLVHELIHYAHGFNSPHHQKFRHPHAGGVMGREFAQRGLLELHLRQKRWLKGNWKTVILQNFYQKTTPKPVVSKTTNIPNPFWFKLF